MIIMVVVVVDMAVAMEQDKEDKTIKAKTCGVR